MLDASKVLASTPAEELDRCRCVSGDDSSTDFGVRYLPSYIFECSDSRQADKYITAIPHLMSIGFTLKKISSPNHVISKFDAIKVPALMAAATAIGEPLIDTIKEVHPNLA